MIARTTKDFQNAVLNKMTFKPYKTPNYTVYKNEVKPELGYFIKYTREGYYDFGIGDYTIPTDFSISFEHSEEIMRFGTVYTGETSFEIEDNPISSFSPSSFFVVEKTIQGKQFWKKGQHFHGAEITIHKRYFDEIIKPNFPNTIDFNNFISNYTYRYLPLEISKIIQGLRSMSEVDKLTSLYLESKILESIALLSNELNSSPENVFTNQLNYGEIKIGKNRYITLTASDAHAIQKAHDILTKEACNPPTIKALSKMVFLNEQKLKAGFSAKYHMSISQYTNSIRMTLAENLLSTTELGIDEISKQLGYNYSGNFIKMFKKTHGKTPLAFRKLKI
ncbi:AraC family transcriptional regulator [Clostridium celatum]|uniref:Transcriptional regulator, AraC family n=1 Tax=Clostridium celatum DSM 1785 TaxID=545697 RepID=L1QEU3_9CLOT|nr:AraC family transcriptional regulator [Clostridium celatum]EKY26456.1 transcriptional regulator, AraC family [Clostridium celatum DSM 1785]MCE9654967.1 helix-turn-helix domain-containing protein [Clostridium celatum]MDU2265998.1 helix-turn-helix domain-containing protein [Clostridium celatum]MDU3723945.1 helix-turn-helix domain-containing protein [Clostridium celatum]MDU6296318.1 helix-turn-helix domain-containing protein [Clostridium celatum]